MHDLNLIIRNTREFKICYHPVINTCSENFKSIYLFCVCVCGGGNLPVCVHHMHLFFSVEAGREHRILCCWIYIQIIVNCHVGAGNQIKVLCKCSKFSYPLSKLSSPHSVFLYRQGLLLRGGTARSGLDLLTSVIN